MDLFQKKSKIYTLAILIFLGLVNMTLFQNCSKSQFSSTAGNTNNSKTSVDLINSDSINNGNTNGNYNIDSNSNADSNTAATNHSRTIASDSSLDLITPRIELSAEKNGKTQLHFKPDQIIYGRVYGIPQGTDLLVCINESLNNCLAPDQGYTFKPAAEYGLTYSAQEKFWRFQIKFDRDIIKYITILSFTKYDATDLYGAVRALNNYVVSVNNSFRVNSLPSEAKVLALDFNRNLNGFGSQRSSNTFKDNEAWTVSWTGLTKENGQYCYEIAGTNKCQTTSDWPFIKTIANSKYDAAGLWSLPSATIYGVTDNRPPAGSTVNIYSKDSSNGAASQTTVKITSHDLVCMYQPENLGIIAGPACQHPELGRSCSNADSIIQGSNPSCGYKLRCTCQ